MNVYIFAGNAVIKKWVGVMRKDFVQNVVFLNCKQRRHL